MFNAWCVERGKPSSTPTLLPNPNGQFSRGTSKHLNQYAPVINANMETPMSKTSEILIQSGNGKDSGNWPVYEAREDNWWIRFQLAKKKFPQANYEVVRVTTTTIKEKLA